MQISYAASDTEDEICLFIFAKYTHEPLIAYINKWRILQDIFQIVNICEFIKISFYNLLLSVSLKS